MDDKIRLALIKKLPRKEGQEGFSLMELAVVVTVLAILAAIVMPSFVCFQRRAKAIAAQKALMVIKDECERNFVSGISDTFTPIILSKYDGCKCI